MSIVEFTKKNPVMVSLLCVVVVLLIVVWVEGFPWQLWVALCVFFVAFLFMFLSWCRRIAPTVAGDEGSKIVHLKSGGTEKVRDIQRPYSGPKSPPAGSQEGSLGTGNTGKPEGTALHFKF